MPERFLLVSTAAVFFGAVAAAQAPPSNADATMLQLMRGLLYPASNVVFAAQGDLNRFPPDPYPATSPNPLTSVFAGWEAVENAAITLAESARLVALPGRTCGNGVAVPVERADWTRFTNDFRQASLEAYKAAQTKSHDAMVEASGALADACLECHRVYRNRTPNDADRCR